MEAITEAGRSPRGVLILSIALGATLVAAAAVALISCQPADPGRETRSNERSTAETEPLGGDSLHARVSLLAEDRALVPGSRQWLGLHFRLDPGWHIYWNGRNDTGYPPALRLDLPAGVHAGELLWPAPVRHVSEGGILDHVYEGDVVLLVPLTVDAGIKSEDRITIRGRAEWLVCRGACVPESTRVSIVLPLAGAADPEGGSPGESARLFAESRARLPQPLRISDSPAEFRWTGNTLEVRAAGATRVLFFPAEECSPLSHPIEDGEAEGEELRIRFAPRPEEISRAAGVLEIRRANGAASFHAIDQRPGGSNHQVNES